MCSLRRCVITWQRMALVLVAPLIVLTACARAPTPTPAYSPPPTPALTSAPRSTPSPAPISTPAPAAAWSSTEAAAHIGERGTVCGPVVDTRYATGSKGKPTFLNFDRAYPNHIFTVVIWGSDRGNFPANPESYYRGKTVCATGLIESYRAKPQIIAGYGNQLQVAR